MLVRQRRGTAARLWEHRGWRGRGGEETLPQPLVEASRGSGSQSVEPQTPVPPERRQPDAPAPRDDDQVDLESLALQTAATARRHGHRPRLPGLTTVVLCGLTAIVALLSLAVRILDTRHLEAQLAQAALIPLAVAFGLYVVDKERQVHRFRRDLENERVLAAAMANRLEEISSLGEVGERMAATHDEEEVLRVLLEAAVRILQADEGSVMLLEDGELVMKCATGHAAQFVGQHSTLHEGLAGYVARRREPLLVQDEIEMADFASLLGSGRIVSAMSVPIAADDRVLGVINLDVVTGERRFSEYDLRALRMFARQAALILPHSGVVRDEEALRRSVADLEAFSSELASGGGDVTQADPLEALEDAVAELPAPRHHHGKLKVLLVDDEPSLLRLLQTALETEGHEVLLASDGATALDRIRREAPDVVLLDVMMPVMDGWEVLEALREAPRRPRVICLTAKANRRDLVKGWMLGADEYLTKPARVADLLATVREVARRAPRDQAERKREALKTLLGGAASRA